jgi:hypothetical protein
MSEIKSTRGRPPKLTQVQIVRIRRMSQESGLSRKEIAIQCEISFSYLSRILNGQRRNDQ